MTAESLLYALSLESLAAACMLVVPAALATGDTERLCAAVFLACVLAVGGWIVAGCDAPPKG